MSDAQLQLLITAAETATAVLQRVEGRLGDLQKAVERFNQASASAAQGASNAWRGFGSVLDDVARIASRVVDSIAGFFKNLVSGALELARSIGETLVHAFEGLVSIAEKAGLAVGATLAAGMIAVGKAGVEMNVAIQGAHVAMTAITGSASTADQLIGELRKTALTTQFTFKDLLLQGQGLAAAWGPQGLGMVIPTIQAFDAAVKLIGGGDIERGQRALMEFRQMLMQPGIEERQIREIERNLPGIGINRLLTQAFGTADTETLQKMGVTGQMAGQAIVAGLLKAFGAGSAQMNQFLPVLLSNFKDAFNEFTAAITANFTPTLTAALARILEVFEKLAQNKSLVQALAVPFDLLGKAISAAADAAPAFVEWLSEILTKENVVNFLSQVVGFFETLAQKVQDFIAAATGGGGIGSIWETFRNAAEKAIDFVLKAWDAFVAVVQYFAEHQDQVWKAVAEGIGFAVKALDVLVGVFVVGIGVQAFAAVMKVVGALGSLGGGAAAAAGAAGGGFGILGSGALVPKVGGNILDRFAGWLGEGPAPARQAPGAAGGAGGQAGQFPGVLGWLQGVGASTLGLAGGAGGDIAGFLQGQFPNVAALFGGAAQAGRQAFQAGGLGSFMADWQRNARAAAAGMNRMLGPAGGGGADGMPPRLGEGGGAGLGGGVAAMPDPKLVKDMVDASRAMFQSNLESVKAFVAAQPEQARLAAEVAQEIPLLKGRMTELAQQAALVAPDSEEYWKLAKEYWTAQAAIGDLETKRDKEIQDARMAAVTAQSEAAKAAIAALPEWQRASAEVAIAIPELKRQQEEIAARLQQAIPDTKEYYDRQADLYRLQGQINQLQMKGALDQARDSKALLDANVALYKAQLENNPFLTPQQRGQAMVPALLEQFRALSRPSPGESPLQAIQRQTSAEGLRGEILRSAGVFGPGGRPQFAGMLGGGTMPLFDTSAFGRANAELNRIQAQGAGARSGGDAGRGTTNIILPVQVGASVPDILALIRQQLEMLERQATGSAASGY